MNGTIFPNITLFFHLRLQMLFLLTWVTMLISHTCERQLIKSISPSYVVEVQQHWTGEYMVFNNVTDRQCFAVVFTPLGVPGDTTNNKIRMLRFFPAVNSTASNTEPTELWSDKNNSKPKKTKLNKRPNKQLIANN